MMLSNSNTSVNNNVFHGLAGQFAKGLQIDNSNDKTLSPLSKLEVDIPDANKFKNKRVPDEWDSPKQGKRCEWDDSDSPKSMDKQCNIKYIE